MKLLAPFLILLVIAVGLTVLKLLHRGPIGQRKLPYRKKDYLLTKAERSFYEVLLSVLGSELTVFAKVRLLDVVWLPANTDDRQAHMNRVMQKHVDFLICDNEKLSPLLVIELDDSSHEAPSRKERDAFVDVALAAAGLPILRVKARQSYNLQELASQISSFLEQKPS